MSARGHSQRCCHQSQSLQRVIRTPEAAWREEIESLHRGDAGLTTAELARKFRIPQRTMRDIITKGLESGRYKKGSALRTDAAGHVQRVPVYSVVEEAK